MYNCLLTVNQNFDSNSTKLQNEYQSCKTLKDSQPCLVSMDNYCLTFVSTVNSEKAIYQTNVKGLIPTINSKEKTLTLNSKEFKSPLLQVQSELAILEKIKHFCQRYSDESLLWNPIVFSTYNTAKEAFFSDNSHENSLSKKVRLSFGIFCPILVLIMLGNFQHVMESCGFYPLDFTLHNVVVFLGGFLWITIATVLLMTFEKLAFKKTIPEEVTIVLESLNTIIGFGLPIYIVNKFRPNVQLALFYTAWSAMMNLKIISYVYFMHELRRSLPEILKLNKRTDLQAKQALEKEVSTENLEVIQKYSDDIPEIVNLKDISYFYCVPTLTYQLWYPKTQKVRWSYVAKLSIQFVYFFFSFFYFMNYHFAPRLRIAAESFRNGTLFEKYQQVCYFTTYFSILMGIFFCLFFHVFLNLLSELFCFGDREFYKDWWYCSKSAEFWNKWNRPVHKWVQRHVYFPLQKRGYSKVTGLVAVFFVSGLIHEYIFCLPGRLLEYYTFLWFWSQSLTIIIEKKLENNHIRLQKLFFGIACGLGGFWIPIVIIIYYNEHLSMVQDKN